MFAKRRERPERFLSLIAGGVTVRKEGTKHLASFTLFPLTWTAFRGSIEILGSENEAPESILPGEFSRGCERRNGEGGRERAHEAKEEESTLIFLLFFFLPL